MAILHIEITSPELLFLCFLRFFAAISILIFLKPTLLLSNHRKNKVRLFHPHEGHLTAAGHRVTADFIRSRLKALEG